MKPRDLFSNAFECAGAPDAWDFAELLAMACFLIGGGLAVLALCSL